MGGTEVRIKVTGHSEPVGAGRQVWKIPRQPWEVEQEDYQAVYGLRGDRRES